MRFIEGVSYIAQGRGGQAPRYGKKRHVTVGLGPSHATRACERVSLAIARLPDSVGQDRLKLWHICQAILTRL